MKQNGEYYFIDTESVKGNRLATLYRYSMCEDAHHVNEFSIVTNNDIRHLEIIEFETRLNKLCYC